MDERLKRSARNEALLREVNERIDELGEGSRALPDDELAVLFHCECGREGCDAKIEMTRAEYHHVRVQQDRFAVAAGHEQAELERVVERSDRYVIVDKLPQAEPCVGADGLPDNASEA